MFQAAYPAFFALYVANERQSSVQAMQLSNGLADSSGLWLGHIMFDSVLVLILSTIIIVIFAAVAGDQFFGLGFFVSGMYAPINIVRADADRIIVDCPRPVRNHWCTVLILCVIDHGVAARRVCGCRGISSDHVHCMCSLSKSACTMLTPHQLYLAGYLLTLTYAATSDSGNIITIIRKLFVR